MKRHIALILIAIICLGLYGCAQTPEAINRDGVLSAQTDVDADVKQAVSDGMKINFSELRSNLPERVERECSSPDNIIRSINAQVTLPEAETLTKFRLAPVEADIDQLLEIFFQERVNEAAYNSETSFEGSPSYIITNEDKTVLYEGLSINNYMSSLTLAYLGYTHNYYILNSNGDHEYDPSLPVIDEQDAYVILISLLNQLDISDITVVETSSMDDGRIVHFDFIPQFTEYLVVPDANAIYGLADASGRQVETIYGNFLQTKAEEQSAGQLLPFDKVIDVAMIQLAKDKSPYEILVDEIYLCHKYLLDEVANTVYAVPAWVFVEKTRRLSVGFAGAEGETTKDITQFIVIDAVSGQIYNSTSNGLDNLMINGV
jgi:hypothetical protein